MKNTIHYIIRPSCILFAIILLGELPTTFAQEIEPQPELTENEKLKISAPSIISTKVYANRRFAFYSTRKKLLDELNVAPDTRKNIRDEFQKFDNDLRMFLIQSTQRLAQTSEVNREVVSNYLSELEEKASGYSKIVKDLLSDEKFEKMKHLMRREHLANTGLAVLMTKDLSQDLDLRDNQVLAIQAIEEKLREELNEKMGRIRVTAQQKMIDLLDEQQKAELREYFDEHFIWD